MQLKNRFPVLLRFSLCLIAAEACAETVHLKNGSALVGERLRDEDSTVVFRVKGIGEIRVAKTEITIDSTQSMVSNPQDREEVEKSSADPSDHSLVFMPTAFTAPLGTWSFEDFELFFLTLSYSPTASTSVTLGALFPIDPNDVEVFTVGVKQRLYQTPGGHAALAATGDFSKLTGSGADAYPAFWTANLVGSVTFNGSGSGDAVMGLHAAIGDAGALRAEDRYDPETGLSNPVTRAHNDLSWALGLEARLTPHGKFLVEYMRGGEFLGNSTNESILNLGFRIHGQRLSADICGFRLLEEDMGNLFLIPMVNIGYRF